MPTPTEHWNSIFSTTPDSELGWYEATSSQTLKFLDGIPNHQHLTVFLPGAGTSVLVDALLAHGNTLILNDISDHALSKLRSRIGTSERVTWLHHDISKPLPENITHADIWIDRAVLHFLLDEAAIEVYFNNIRSIIPLGGYVLLAEFATSGAPHCAGLKLHRYAIEEMTARMGTTFELVNAEQYTFITPFGDPRPYLYALYTKRHD